MALFFVSSFSFGQNDSIPGGGGTPYPPIDPTSDCRSFKGETLFRNGVGLNYFWNNDAGSINGIGTKFRQFTLWHNAGWEDSCQDGIQNNNESGIDCGGIDPDKSSCRACHCLNGVQDADETDIDCGGSCGEYPSTYHVYNRTHPFNPSDVNEFYPHWKYDYNNFVGSPIGTTLQNMLQNDEIDALFPAMTSASDFLSTQYTWNNGTWINHNYPERYAIWRKPIPFKINNNLSLSSPYHIFTDFDSELPSSYKFYAEYITHFAAYFDRTLGENTLSPNRFAGSYIFNGQHANTHIELWNEPDAWWTRPNDFGYFSPKELAAMCNATLNTGSTNNSGLSTSINGSSLSVGILQYIDRSNFKIISPSLHEMDIDYYKDFLAELNNFPGTSDFKFDVVGFHHYSAYKHADLAKLNAITTDNIVSKSLHQATGINGPNGDPVDGTRNYDFSGGSFKTVELESTAGFSDASWICPELDGYVERGQQLANEIDADNIWITEWGYPSCETTNCAKYPASLHVSNDETMARWLMRGYLSYDISPISASFWHWYQDSDPDGWDTYSGLLNNQGNRKLAWTYLKTMMSEIGNKKFQTSCYSENNCEACDEDGSNCIVSTPPGAYIQNGSLYGEIPELPCPAILQYGNPTDERDVVFPIWFPFMVDREETISIFLKDLRICWDPLKFYWVEPTANGSVESEHFFVSKVANTNPPKYFIDLPVSEKPIFLHFEGEQPGPEPGGNGCNWSFTQSCSSECTKVSMSLELDYSGNCENLPKDPDLHNITIEQNGVTASGQEATYTISGNTVTIDINGLAPCSSYDFNVTVYYSVLDNDGNSVSGVHSETISCSTTCPISECANQIAVSTNPVTFSCENAAAEICLTVDMGDLDPDAFSVQGSYSEILDENSSTSEQPLNTNESGNWNDNGDGTFNVCFSIGNISIGGCYSANFTLLDNNGNLYEEISVNFCEDGNLAPSCVVPQIPGPITTTPTDECDLTFCFNQVAGVTHYELIIQDKNGKIVSPVPSVDGTAGSSGIICLTVAAELMDGLDGDTYVGQIISYAKDANGGIDRSKQGSGPRFDIGLCCVNPNPDDIAVEITQNCRVAYVRFCLEGNHNCFSEENLQFEFDPGLYPLPKVSNHSDIISEGNGCYLVKYFTPDIGSGGTTNYYIHIFNDNGIDFVLSGTITFEGCAKSGDPDIPHEDPNPEFSTYSAGLEYSTVSYNTGTLKIFATVPELDSLISENISIGNPVRYVIGENDTIITKVNQLWSQLSMSLPVVFLDSVSLNERYFADLLMDGIVYELYFPDLPGYNGGLPPQQRKANQKGDGNSSLTISPNPTTGNVQVLLKKGVIETLYLYNYLGKLVYSTDVNNQSIQLDLNHFTKGIYFIEVKTTNNKQLKQKLIIQ